MIRFTATIKKFGEQGEKTGWTFIAISPDQAAALKPGNKRSFRVKGTLDGYQITKVALMPMGDGSFVISLNAVIRKGIRKQVGQKLQVSIEEDKEQLQPPDELIE